MLERLAGLFSIPVLATLACGPAGIVGDAGTTTTGPDTLESSSSQPDPTSTSETGTGETGPSTGATTMFVPLPGDVLVNECYMFEQDCPDGEKCVPYGSTGSNWDAAKCVAIMGDQASGEPCWYGGVAEGTDNCDANSVCWDVMDVEGQPVGTCTTICTGAGDAPMCPQGTVCDVFGDGKISLCIVTCDPLAQDCVVGMGCFWANNGFNCIFTTDDIPPGQPCGFINSCAGGLLCLDGSFVPDCAGSACCSPFCDITLGDGQCDAIPGTSCVAFFEQDTAPPGYDDLGVCASL